MANKMQVISMGKNKAQIVVKNPGAKSSVTLHLTRIGAGWMDKNGRQYKLTGE